MPTPGQNEYLLSALPALGELGQTPPITPAELLEHIAPVSGPSAIVRAVLLSDDLLQRQATLAGEIDQPTPAVLSPEQLRDEAPLPECLAVVEADAQPVAGEDLLWEAYFRHAAAVARSFASGFLSDWTAFEVGLRNAIAASRARLLELDVESYLVATDLAADEDDFVTVVNDWSAAATPLAGLRVLDEARWRWLTDNDAWFTFRDDELAAYAVRLMLLTRWHRLSEAEQSRSPASQAGPTLA